MGYIVPRKFIIRNSTDHKETIVVYTCGMRKITEDIKTPTTLQTLFTHRLYPQTEAMLEEALQQLSYELAEFKAYRIHVELKGNKIHEEIGSEDIEQIEYLLTEDDEKLLPLFTGIEKELDSPIEFHNNSHVYACDIVDIMSLLGESNTMVVVNPGSDDIILTPKQLEWLLNHSDTTL